MKKYVLSILLLLIFVLAGCTQSEVDVSSPNPSEQLSQAATPVPEVEAPKESETSAVIIQDLMGVDDNMKRIIEFLTVNKNVHLATVGPDGKPSIRTIQFQFFENGRIYFQTDTEVSVYRDLKNQPYMEFIASTPDHKESLRVRGEVVFEYNKELIDRVLTLGPNIKKIYGSADNPILTMFYIEHGSATIYEFSDKVQGTTLMYEW